MSIGEWRHSTPHVDQCQRKICLRPGYRRLLAIKELSTSIQTAVRNVLDHLNRGGQALINPRSIPIV